MVARSGIGRIMLSRRARLEPGEVEKDDSVSNCEMDMSTSRSESGRRSALARRYGRGRRLSEWSHGHRTHDPAHTASSSAPATAHGMRTSGGIVSFGQGFLCYVCSLADCYIGPSVPCSPTASAPPRFQTLTRPRGDNPPPPTMGQGQ